MTRDERFPDLDQLVRVRCKVVCHQHTVDAVCFWPETRRPTEEIYRERGSDEYGTCTSASIEAAAEDDWPIRTN